MAVNDELKKFSKIQISVLAYSGLNTIITLACIIWTILLFKKHHTDDKEHDELIFKIFLIILSATGLLGQLAGFYGLFRANLWASIAFNCCVSFHLGFTFVEGFSEHFFWVGSGADVGGIVAISLYLSELKGKFFMSYTRDLGNANKI